MAFKKLLSKIIYKEASHLVKQQNKRKANERYLREANKEFEEKERQNQHIQNQKKKFFQDKINIAENYLSDEVDVLGMFERNQELIDSWFFTNWWLKPIEKRISANYSKMKLTVAQRNELAGKLNIQPEEYVQHIFSSTNEDSTLAYIIDNTPTAEKLREQQDKKGYSLYINAHYADASRQNMTICFGLVIKEDAKQPF